MESKVGHSDLPCLQWPGSPGASDKIPDRYDMLPPGVLAIPMMLVRGEIPVLPFYPNYVDLMAAQRYSH